MKKANLSTILLTFTLLCLNSSAMMRYQEPKTYEDKLKHKVDIYKKYAYWNLQPTCAAVGLHYPPKNIALLVFKQSKHLELWGKDDGNWKHIKDYHILAASGHPGPKLRSMDRQVPEGVYDIVGLNPDSHFHLSMKVSYPNSFDLQEATLDRRKNLGGDIFIHGSNQSIGCVAIGDDNINQIFVLAYLVGIKNIKVIIAPNDLRTEPPIYVHNDPQWVHDLYAAIKLALEPFRA